MYTIQKITRSEGKSTTTKKMTISDKEAKRIIAELKEYREPMWDDRRQRGSIAFPTMWNEDGTVYKYITIYKTKE